MDRRAEDLKARARRAYEGARWRRALVVGVAIPPAAALAFLECAQPRESVICSILLGAAVALLFHRGMDWGRGARAGLFAGLAPFLFPIAIETFGTPAMCALLPWFCAAGGVVAGFALLARRRGAPRNPRAYWLAAGLVTVLAGAAGCLLAGAAGLLGLAVGLAAGAVPALALKTA